MKKRPFYVVAATTIMLLQIACKEKKEAGSASSNWRLQSNIYEVNVRQYTPEGTFSAFEKHLPRLKEMGVDIIWFMPITPIGIKGRKMTAADLGSYYAVRNYKAVNPEFGTLEDFQNLVKKAHRMGFKVITDWVANHSAIDNEWVSSHPQFYVKDSAGHFVSPHDWTDVYKLDYTNRELQDSMTAAMRWWIDNTGIDGFRCDVAEEVGKEFWDHSIPALRAVKDIYLLAEGEAPWLYESGFDATYQWHCMHLLEDLCKKKIDLSTFKSRLVENINKYPRNVQRMYFTSNHDENSWSGTEYEKYGDAAIPLALFSQTMYQSIPLIYSGQEAGNKKRLRFFTKDTIDWNNLEKAGFYSKLLTLRKSHPALSSDASWRLLKTDKEESILAYEKRKEKNRIIIVLNLSSDSVRYTFTDLSCRDHAIDLMGDWNIPIKMKHPDELPPFGFRILKME
jgi:glycosidase